MSEHTKNVTVALLSAALKLAATKGYNRITRDEIAQAAGVSPALVSARLGTMDAMRRSVMRAAIRERVLPVVAQGIVARDKHALAADVELRRQAMEHACNG